MTDWKEISIQEAKDKIDSGNVTVIDIRDSASYEATHIPDAIQLSGLTIEGFIATTDKATPLIVYCYHGHSSQGAASFFVEKGFKEVYSMAGGFEAWRYTEPTDP
jgi:thiosulfate sulfurtransferase